MFWPRMQRPAGLQRKPMTSAMSSGGTMVPGARSDSNVSHPPGRDVGVDQVALHHERLGAEGGGLLGGGLGRLAVPPVVDDDVVAPLGQEQRRGPADAPGTPRDEGHGAPVRRCRHLRNRLKSGERFSWKATVPSADSSVS